MPSMLLTGTTGESNPPQHLADICADACCLRPQGAEVPATLAGLGEVDGDVYLLECTFINMACCLAPKKEDSTQPSVPTSQLRLTCR